MKYIVLALAVTAALAVSAGVASAQPPGYGYAVPAGPSLYAGGYYSTGPLDAAPVYPAPVPVPVYRYPSYGYSSGYSVTLGSPQLSVTFGSSSYYPAPRYGYVQPYYGGYYGGRRW